MRLNQISILWSSLVYNKMNAKNAKAKLYYTVIGNTVQ